MTSTAALVAGAVLLSGVAMVSAATGTYDDNVRATYTKQTYGTAGAVVDVTFKGFSQYGTKVRGGGGMVAVVPTRGPSARHSLFVATSSLPALSFIIIGACCCC